MAATLQEVQTRIKRLTANREQITSAMAVERNRLDETYKQLRSLGILNPENLTSQELQDLAEKLGEERDEKLKELIAKVEAGEALMQKYREL